MRVLVVGAGGFIGRHVAAALAARGHSVVAGVRPGTPVASAPRVLECDLARDHDPGTWIDRLGGFDGVVNAAGILRESGANGFEAVHVAGPTALWAACEAAGVARVVQVSALGDPRTTRFIDSKHRGDEALMAGKLEFTVLRPSVVHSPRDCYGGTRWLRALAALPGALLLPGAGDQRLAPVTLKDLADAVATCLERPRAPRAAIELVGPRSITLAEYLSAYREWLGAGPGLRVQIPMPLVRAVSRLGELLGRGPLGTTMLRMLEQGNVGAKRALADTTGLLGRAPESVAHALAASPATESDRWQAGLVVLQPVLRIAVAMLWLVSAAAGFLAPLSGLTGMLDALGWSEATGSVVIAAASTLDAALGGLLLVGWRPRWVLSLMLVSVLAYTAWLGIAIPTLWLDPLGALAKNIVLIPALATLLVLERRR